MTVRLLETDAGSAISLVHQGGSVPVAESVVVGDFGFSRSQMHVDVETVIAALGVAIVVLAPVVFVLINLIMGVVSG